MGGRDELSAPLSAREHEAITSLWALRSRISGLTGGVARRAEKGAGAESGS